VSATDSQVDLTGTLEDDGRQFVATETIQPTMLTMTIKCPRAPTISGQSQATFPPLTFTVASSGGVSTQPFLGGMARIVVVPQEDKAAAFNAGNPEVRIGSPSSWLWGDYFPGLYGALLALR
jgi:hypothetical protein